MITIANKQDKVKLSVARLKKDAQYVLGLLDYADYDLGIWLIDNELMQQYNKQYRNKDVPTDVLSFPYHQLKPGERIKPETEDDKNIGDLLMSLEYVEAQQHEDFYARIQKLLVHGVCHLLGHDHDSEETDAVMQDQEAFLLEKLQNQEVKKTKKSVSPKSKS
jgi:probable rRNA maturation factor